MSIKPKNKKCTFVECKWKSVVELLKDNDAYSLSKCKAKDEDDVGDESPLCRLHDGAVLI